MAKILKADKHLFFRLDAHYRLIMSLVIAAGIYFAIHNSFSSATVILLTWIGFAMAIIVMDWIIIASSHPREVRRIAKLQDSSRTFLFLFVIMSSLVSMAAIVFLLKSTKGQHGSSVDSHVLLAIGAVFVSWWLVHTIFTLRYAHLYYDTDTDSGEPKAGGGLQFPGDEAPDYMDFVYFSFVLGMTFQVSDVEISSREIRRLAWLHGLLSFAFNTFIVALSINVISGLISG